MASLISLVGNRMNPDFNFELEDGMKRMSIDYPTDILLYKDEFILYTFPQTWGNTSCGHGGIAGQAMTTAYTVIVINNRYPRTVYVYFNRRFAYSVKDCNDKFITDMKRYSLKSVNDSNNGIYYETLKESEF